ACDRLGRLPGGEHYPPPSASPDDFVNSGPIAHEWEPTFLINSLLDEALRVALSRTRGRGGLPSEQRRAERMRAVCRVLRHLFSPFRHVALAPWRTRITVGLARRIYDEEAFDCMPILADALEDVGCTDGAVLAHCRSGREHVRGCWVVDALLGRSQIA